ncbi:hypothetical protein [Gallaecimonas pentaromativorans]|uniref:hypothetical protein n=1 Tax=Gallaecimonas pentaromativorans TaxID=584787 RepID=UPI003A91DA21
MDSKKTWAQIAAPGPSKTTTEPKTRLQYESRSGRQVREFTTSAGGKQRSQSVSTRHERRQLTIDEATNKVVKTGEWQHIKDTNRQHRHPGGKWHEPTAATGAVGGSTTTAQQRTSLDNMVSTVRKSSTTWK